MRRGSVPEAKRTGRRLRCGVALALLAVALAGCGRSGHYAPVVNGGAAGAGASAGIASGGGITVRNGDSLYKIAKRYGVPLRALIDANRIAPPYTIYPGQKLNLPATDVHVVARGDTVYQIAERYGVEPGALVRVNNLSPPYRLRPGQKLSLPGGRGTSVAAARPAEPAPARATETAAPSRAASSAPAASAAADPEPARAAAPARPAGPPPARSAGGFLWPVDGKLLSRFGSLGKGLQNDGINIAASRGAPVRAIENGVVAYSGNELRGFGNLLLVKHDGGWISAYAHNGELLVRSGEVVKKGQVIARVGSSGSVDTPQLHFELRRGNRAVDPERYLGQRSALLFRAPEISRGFS